MCFMTTYKYAIYYTYLFHSLIMSNLVNLFDTCF